MEQKVFSKIFFNSKNNLNEILTPLLDTTQIVSSLKEINTNMDYLNSDNSGGVPSLDNEPYYTLMLNTIKETFNNPDILNERYGYVSLSGNGKMLVIGSPNNISTENGYVYIYEYDDVNNIWDPNYSVLSDNGNFGIIVDIDRQSSNYIVIGNSNTNKITIYEKINTNWVTYRDITINEGTIQSASLSGNILVVGTDTNTIIYKNENGNLNEIQNYNISAHSVSISGDEDKIVIGDHNRNTINIFEYTDTWTMIQTFTGETNEQIGWIVKISYDGYNITYGAPFANNNKGLIRNIMYKTNGIWEQHVNDITGINDGDKFGWSIDISINGNYIIVGAPQTSATSLYETNINTDLGYVKLFEYFSNEWTEITNLTETTTNTGFAVSMDLYNYNFVYATKDQVIRDYIPSVNYESHDILTFPHTNSETGEEAIFYILNTNDNIPVLRPISIGTGYVGDSLTPRNYTTLSGKTYEFDIFFNQVGYNGEAPITNDIPTNNVTIVNGGENYKIGDYINVISEEIGSGGIYIVKNVDGNGSVTEIQRFFQGQNYNLNSTFSFHTNNDGSGVELSFNELTTIYVNISQITDKIYSLSKTNRYNINDMSSFSNEDEYWMFLYNNMDSIIDNWVKTFIFIIEHCFQHIPNSFQYDDEKIIPTKISPTSLYKNLISTNSNVIVNILQKFELISSKINFNCSHIINIYNNMFWGTNSVIYMFLQNNLKFLINKIKELEYFLQKMSNLCSVNSKNFSKGEYQSLFLNLQNARKDVIVKIINTGQQLKIFNKEIIF